MMHFIDTWLLLPLSPEQWFLGLIISALVGLILGEIHKYRRYQEMTEQEKWDEQIEMNRSADWRSAHMIASKMEKCRHNPRNGGTEHGSCPYYIDDDEDPKRAAADSRRWGMR
jgi:hypothetical protein